MAEEEERPFAAEKAKTGRAGCKKCKQKIEQGSLRIAKVMNNPFGGDGGGKMKAWHHVNCLFEVLSKARATTRRIEDPAEDIEGWDDLEKEDQDQILSHLSDEVATRAKNRPPPPKVKKELPSSPAKKGSSNKKGSAEASSELSSSQGSNSVVSMDKVSVSKAVTDPHHKDNSFREFRRICARLADTPAYLEKSNIVREFLSAGTSGDKFAGDAHLWVKMLLPGVGKRIYNLQSKQLIKLFSKILNTDHDSMMEDLEQGDVANTVKLFFEQSQHVQPPQRSTLTLPEVDEFLEELSGLTREEEQIHHFKSIIRKCTSNDLQMIIRCIKHDLRIGAGPKHILEGVHEDAYQAFQTSRDLDAVMAKVQNDAAALSIAVSLMTPCLPMLAEVCKSVEQAMKRCPNGMYSEVKYDGERVQVHKRGTEFKYFSRSLKPVQAHKVNHFSKYIPEAFPYGRDLILDSEVLLIDTITGDPLPFGSLGVHKKTAFKEASVCLFVFDCLFYNGEVLLGRPMKERRKILRQNMKEVPNHVVFSEAEEFHDSKQLEKMIARVLSQGLEGLVLKDLKSTYEPGKRRWLKVKKDYLCGGAMADTADLVTLGAWFGTGNKGGMMSIFLMGCWDPAKQRWCTVTKVHGGHDDKTLEKLQTELQMVKISKEPEKVPAWLKCTRTMVPDFVAKDPKEMPVWEITGAEFTQHDVHTAGISVRFPRVTRIRSDKTWREATTLPELWVLFENSRHGTDVASLFDSKNGAGDDDNSSNADNSTKVKENLHVDSDPIQSTKIKENKKQTSSNNKKHPLKIKTEAPSPTKKQPSNEAPSSKKLKTEDISESNSSLSTNMFVSSASSSKPRIRKPLPDVFAGVSMVLPSWASSRRDELTRYFIAYGGEVLSATRAHHATHALYDADHPSVKRDSSTGRPRSVSTYWLWDSIRSQKLQPSNRYSP